MRNVLIFFHSIWETTTTFPANVCMRVTSAIKLRENLELERNISRALKIPLQLDGDDRSMCDFGNVHLVLCNSCAAVFVGDVLDDGLGVGHKSHRPYWMRD